MKRCVLAQQDLLHVFASLSALGPTQQMNYEPRRWEAAAVKQSPYLTQIKEPTSPDFYC
jgi:hypothetical protein